MILSTETSVKILNYLLKQMEQMNLFPVIGAEIEFYLSPSNHNEFSNSWQAQELDLDFLVEEEKGINLFEIKIEHHANIMAQIEKLTYLKEKISNQALRQGMRADFRAKPFSSQPGSALHIHLHLENNLGENLYIKQKDKETPILLHSIAGLCATMQENMLLFAPYEEAYLRYQVEHVATPSKICWGGNNRSAAIRMPLDQKFNRRLEHRVACADSSPLEVINAILVGIIKGVKEQLSPPNKLHGNAFLEQYEFPRLTQDYSLAQEDFTNSLINDCVLYGELRSFFPLPTVDSNIPNKIQSFIAAIKKKIS